MSSPSESLNFRIQIEERFQARAQLLLDLFLAAFEHVDGDVRLVPVGKLHRSLPHFGHILGRQQPHAVNQCQIRHALNSNRNPVPSSQYSVPGSSQPKVLTEYWVPGTERRLWVIILPCFQNSFRSSLRFCSLFPPFLSRLPRLLRPNRR